PRPRKPSRSWASPSIRPSPTTTSTVSPSREPDHERLRAGSMSLSLGVRAAIVAVGLLIIFLSVWHIATRGGGPVAQMDPEYAKLMGATATQGKSAMPGPLDVGAKLFELLRQPFYDKGPNDKGIGIQLAYS